MSDVRVDFKSDSSQVDKNIDKIKGGLGGISSLAGTIGTALKASFVAIGAAAAGTGAAFVTGSKDIIDYGGELDDLSTKTGISIKDLVLLQEAFKFAGVSADTVSKAVLGLNNKLANPSDKLVGVLDSLGLSLNDLNKLPIGEKFTVIGQAIGNLSDTSEKAAVASTLFGRNLGQGLLPLFNNKNALKEAAVSVGSLGENMQKYAPAFAKIGDAVDSITTKFRQFFAEALGKNADKLVALADKLIAIDLGAAGAGLGDVLSQLLSVMEGKTLKQAIVDGIAEATPILVNAFIEVAEIIAQGVMKGLEGGNWENVTVSKTIDDLKFGFAMLKEGVTSLPGAMGIGTGAMALRLGTPVGAATTIGGGLVSGAYGSRFEVAARLQDMKDWEERFKRTGELMKDDSYARLAREQKVVTDGWFRMMKDTKMYLESLMPKFKLTDSPFFKSVQDVISNTKAKIMKPTEMRTLGGPIPLTDLQRVGGAKIFSGIGGPNPMVEEQKKTNKTLMDIYNEQKKTKIPSNFLASFA